MVDKFNKAPKNEEVVSKINEIIDNMAGTITVDQTYDPTSPNAQSGVAIAGAGFVTTDTTQTISGAKTFTQPVTIQNGAGTGSIMFGGDVNASTSTANVRKLGRINSPTYANPNLSATLLGWDTSGDDSSPVTNNTMDAVCFGGMKKITNCTSPMSITFCVTDTRNATAAANKKYALAMDANSAIFGVQPKYNGNNLLTGITSTMVINALNYTPQEELTSGTNIKTINNIPILGSGNIDTSEIFVAEYNVTTFAEIETAYNAGKQIVLSLGTRQFVLSYLSSSNAQFSSIYYALGNTTSEIYECASDDTWTNYLIKVEDALNKTTTINSSSTNTKYPSAKCVYDNLLLKADTTLSNVSSIDSNSAVQTALDGKVSKTGDTMSGNLAVSNNAPAYFIKNTSASIGEAPDEVKWSRLIIRDKNDATLGFLGHRQGTDNAHSMRFVCRKPDNTEDTAIVLGFTLAGSPYCSFPNSPCVDGQWEKKIVVLANNVPAPTTTDLPYDLSSYLPNDNYNYEILLWGRVVTGTTSGNRTVLNIQSDLASLRICEARTRANSTTEVAAAAIIPVNARELNILALSGNTGTVYLALQGYRRIGTNS